MRYNVKKTPMGNSILDQVFSHFATGDASQLWMIRQMMPPSGVGRRPFSKRVVISLVDDVAAHDRADCVWCSMRLWYVVGCAARSTHAKPKCRTGAFYCIAQSIDYIPSVGWPRAAMVLDILPMQRITVNEIAVALSQL